MILNKYLGVKLVDGEPMTAGEFSEKIRPLSYTGDDQNGYKVVYEDGYPSWSPKAVFEKAYRRIDNLTFGLAVEAAKQGMKITRACTYGICFLVLMPGLKLPPHSSQEPGAKVNDRTAKHIGEDTPLDSQPYFALYDAEENKWQPGWIPNQEDILAEDWIILE
jgi:hypothetical protein